MLPDLLVVGSDDLGRRWIDEPLLLGVEIVAPTTRLIDERVKRIVYEEAGVASYWIFDPDEAVLTVLELDNDRYVEQTFEDDEVFEAERPFPVQIVPADLLCRASRTAI